MTARRGSGWAATAAFAAAALIGPPAWAANARLERVLLLPSVDRSSIVFELTAEPRQVSTRRVSDSVVEVEAGPGIESVVPQLLKAPSNVRFIDSVTVRVMPGADGPVVRARIALTASAQAVVRSAGRRVYVDVSAVPDAPAAPAAAASSPRSGAPPRPAAAAARVSVEDAYRAAVRPPLDKLRELGPFLASAATSSDAGVASALVPTLASVRATLAALQPPEPARGSHTMVLSAVDRIAVALAPGFSGDRAAAVRQSITTIDVVGGVLLAPAN